MKLAEIKQAVQEGKTVHYHSALYTVICDAKGQWLIKYSSNGYCIGLTWMDEVTMNGDEEDFYIADDTAAIK